MVNHEVLLNTDEDFGVILEALDAFVDKVTAMSFAIEMTTAAIREAEKLEPEEKVTDEDFAKSVAKNMDNTKVVDKTAKVKDKIILLKAKVIMTKEYLRSDKVRSEINNLIN